VLGRNVGGGSVPASRTRAGAVRKTGVLARRGVYSVAATRINRRRGAWRAAAEGWLPAWLSGIYAAAGSTLHRPSGHGARASRVLS